VDVYEEWDDMVYNIRRHKVDKIKSDIKMMRDFNPNVHFRKNGETMLHICAEYNLRSIFEWLVANHKAGVLRKNEAGETPFIVAAREGKLDIIRLYVENYSEYEDWDIDHKMADGWTALHYAAMNGFCSIVEYLIKNGANIDASDRLHRSALHWACRFNNVKMVKLLLSKHIKVETTDIEM
jgi:ankyrin repeat protein